MGSFRWLGGCTAADEAPAGRSAPAPVPPPTGDPVMEYKLFVDALVPPGFLAQWVREGGWRDQRTDAPDDSANQWLAALTAEQRELVAEMVQRAEDWGTWRVLNVIDLYAFRLARGGVELPALFPYGLTTLWGSWACRKQGDAWPQHPEDTFSSIKDDD